MPHKHRPRLTWLSVALASCAIPAAALADLTWTPTVNGTYSFFDAANWDGSVAPGNREEHLLLFNQGARNQTVELNLPDGHNSWTLLGGIHFRGSSIAPGLLDFSLKGQRLILEGGALKMSVAGGGTAERTIAQFSEGTLQVGTSTQSAAIKIGSDIAENNFAVLTMRFASGSTLDTFNTSSISIASENFGQSTNLQLDLTNALLQSGARAHTIAVTEDLLIGRHTGPTLTADRHVSGSLKLGQVSMIDIGRDLILGQRLTGTNAGTALTSGSFTIEHNAAPVTLKVGRDLKIGVGDRASGEIKGHSDQEWHVEIGEGAKPPSGVIHIGYKDVPGTTSAAAHTDGSFTTGGGTFNATIKELIVGKNNLSTGTSFGRLDFSRAETGIVHISGSAIIGQGLGAQGEFLLSGGSVTSQKLIVGDTTGTAARSLLSLNNTTWSVSEQFSIGSQGTVLIASTLMGPALDLLSDNPLHFTIQTGGVLSIAFESEETGLWGLRISGDQTAYLTALLADGRLVATGHYAAQAAISYDGSHTTFGVAPIPEPSTLALALTAGVIGLGWRRYYP